MCLSSKLTIEKLTKKYLFFSKIEEMRYNPEKPGEKENNTPSTHFTKHQKILSY